MKIIIPLSYEIELEKLTNFTQKSKRAMILESIVEYIISLKALKKDLEALDYGDPKKLKGGKREK